MGCASTKDAKSHGTNTVEKLGSEKQYNYKDIDVIAIL